MLLILVEETQQLHLNVPLELHGGNGHELRYEAWVQLFVFFFILSTRDSDLVYELFDRVVLLPLAQLVHRHFPEWVETLVVEGRSPRLLQKPDQVRKLLPM